MLTHVFARNQPRKTASISLYRQSLQLHLPRSSLLAFLLLIQILAVVPRKDGGAPARARLKEVREERRKERGMERVMNNFDRLLLCFPGMLRGVAAVALAVLPALAYRGIRPPPPKRCGSPGGPPITASRVRLRDGRNLAYKEHGVPRELAEHKIIFVHGSIATRHDAVIATDVSPAVLEELKVYVLSFDKPGYGESDPDPKRTPKSLALDIEELADQLGLGTKFYVVGHSMGGQATWGVLKYIPRRLAGAALTAPVINYWWPGFPADISREGYYSQPPQDQWALRVVHYAPWLTYWWNTQKWFPASSVVRPRHILGHQDMEIIPKMIEHRNARNGAWRPMVRQQGEAESIHRDLVVGFGSWEFDPMEIENPFPNGEGAVHLWQGDDDRRAPVLLQRHIAQKLSWIQYHELPGAGHFFPYADGMSEAILKALIAGPK